MTKLIPAALLAFALAGPSVAGKWNDVPAVTPTGPARSCVALSQLRDSQVRNDRVIDFMTGHRTGYRVTLDQACPSLGFERAFSYATSLSQLCQQDIITVLHQSGGIQPGASCGLAPFQPVRFADRR